jgi:molybdopterin-containing oxidoreductase family membrane subunit
VGILAVVVLIGLIAFGNMLIHGLAVTGLNRPVMWAFLITNFVFWVGISHAGVMISAILRLSQAEWRFPVTRAAEILTVFSLATAALFPVIHTGRPWRVIYWVFPYDFDRGIWPNVRSALVWDPSAIFTYLTGSALFIYFVLIPDLAICRDQVRGWRRHLYSALALGYRGTGRQWKIQILAGILLASLILPVFVSVHSIVSWDFAMALVPAWHVTLFAPYFVIGAIWSGVAAVVTMMAILRRVFHLETYITPDHFDAIGRLLIAVGNGWFFFLLLDNLFALYGNEPADVTVMEMRLFEWPWNLLFALFFISGYFFPMALLIFRRVRRSIGLMVVATISINIGMWLERYLIIVPGLARKFPLTFSWGSYIPSLTEIILVIASFALVTLGVLMFSKFFPLIPLSDQKEGQMFATTMRIGRREIPAVIRE